VRITRRLPENFGGLKFLTITIRNPLKISESAIRRALAYARQPAIDPLIPGSLS
jgi:hypothetical protein